MKNLWIVALCFFLIGCSGHVHEWKVIQKTVISGCEDPDSHVMDEFTYASDVKAYVFGATNVIEECECGKRKETTIYGKEAVDERKTEPESI